MPDFPGTDRQLFFGFNPDLSVSDNLIRAWTNFFSMVATFRGAEAPPNPEIGQLWARTNEAETEVLEVLVWSSEDWQVLTPSAQQMTSVFVGDAAIDTPVGEYQAVMAWDGEDFGHVRATRVLLNAPTGKQSVAPSADTVIEIAVDASFSDPEEITIAEAANFGDSGALEMDIDVASGEGLYFRIKDAGGHAAISASISWRKVV